MVLERKVDDAGVVITAIPLSVADKEDRRCTAALPVELDMTAVEQSQVRVDVYPADEGRIMQEQSDTGDIGQ